MLSKKQIRQEFLGLEIPVVSASWKASVPIKCVGTCPVMHTNGTESINASVNPVMAFVAPGPEVTNTHPTFPVDLAKLCKIYRKGWVCISNFWSWRNERHNWIN